LLLAFFGIVLEILLYESLVLLVQRKRPDSCEDIDLVAKLLVKTEVEGQVEGALPGCQHVMRKVRGC
jgi:hypothetical protein